MKILVVFNTCGISGRDHQALPYYINSIVNILKQDFPTFDIVVSSCLNSPAVKENLIKCFYPKIFFNFINIPLPVNITFNYSVQLMEKACGPYDAFLYIDSGLNFTTNTKVLKTLNDLHLSKSLGITSCSISNDFTNVVWEAELKNLSDQIVLPVGKAINGHVMLFDKSLYLNYRERLLPDIFASHCTESVLTFLTAGVNKKWGVDCSLVIDHLIGLDGSSSGFPPHLQPVPPWQHLFTKKRTIFDIINQQEAKDCGFGYEECQKILVHDPSKYDSDGNCLDAPRLRAFIEKNLFLTNEEFDYNHIPHNSSM